MTATTETATTGRSLYNAPNDDLLAALNCALTEAGVTGESDTAQSERRLNNRALYVLNIMNARLQSKKPPIYPGTNVKAKRNSYGNCGCRTIQAGERLLIKRVWLSQETWHLEFDAVEHDDGRPALYRNDDFELV